MLSIMGKAGGKAAMLLNVSPVVPLPSGPALGLKEAEDLGPHPESTLGRPSAPTPTLELDRTSGLPSPDLSADREHVGGLGCFPGSPLGENQEPSSEIDSTPEPSQEVHRRPDRPPPPPTPDGESAGRLSRLPGTTPEAACAPTLGLSVGTGPPSPTLAQPPGEELVGKSGAYPGPSRKLAQGSPDCAPTPRFKVEQGPPDPILALGPDEEPAEKLAASPEPPPEFGRGPQADGGTVPARIPKLCVCTGLPSPALFQMLDEEPIGTSGSVPEPPPEADPGTPSGVGPTSVPAPGLHVVLAPASPVLAQAPDEEPMGKAGTNPELPLELESRPLGVVGPTPSSPPGRHAAAGPPCTTLSQAPEEGPMRKLDRYSSPPTELDPRTLADVHLIPSERANFDEAPCPPSPVLAQAPDEEPTGKPDAIPEPPPELESRPLSVVGPTPSSPPGPHVVPGAPYTTLSQEPEEGPMRKLDPYSSPPTELDPGTPADVDPIPSERANFDEAPSSPSSALAQAPEEESAGMSDSYPVPSPERVPGPPADMEPVHAATPGLHVAPGPPSTALAQAPDEGPAGKLDCYPGSPPEQSSRPPSVVSSIPTATADLDVIPCPLTPAVAQAPDTEPVGNSDSYPGPPPELSHGPQADCDIKPAAVLELSVPTGPSSPAPVQALDEGTIAKADFNPEPRVDLDPGPPGVVGPTPTSPPGPRVAPGPPHTALSHAPEEEPIGKLNSSAEPPPELNPGPPVDVDSIPSGTADVDTALGHPCLVLAEAPEEESAGKWNPYRGPPPEPSVEPPTRIDPVPAATLGLTVALGPPSTALALVPECKQVATPTPQQLLSPSQGASASQGDPFLPSAAWVFVWFICCTVTAHIIHYSFYYLNW
nr:basic proline-rich protein-like isoform X1 [Loxodonta africana]